jgi:hypothetical protein
MFRSWNTAATVDFYFDAPGFECTGKSDEPDWGTLQRDNVAPLVLSGPNDHERDVQPCFTGSVYFTCDKIDDRIRDRVKVCYPIEDFVYGMRAFANCDNNGYLLQFGMPLES